MATIISRKIVIRARLINNSDSDYLERLRAERARQDEISRLLLRWGRGFNLVDAPPHRNEWTRGRGLWYNDSHRR